MGIEIERKFLITNDSWRYGADGKVVGVPYVQGYLSRGTGRTVRIRIAEEKAFITIKGAISGISRSEFEYPIPTADAAQMLTLCDGPIIEKTRYKLLAQEHLWEIDEFHGANEGLLIAEIELTHADQEVILPAWLGKEVTGNHRYYNSNLTVHPYSKWRKSHQLSHDGLKKNT